MNNSTEKASPVVSLIVTHNSRLQCFVAKLFDTLKQLYQAFKEEPPPKLHAIDRYYSEIKKGKIRFKNCAIMELIIKKENISLSLIYEGSLNGVSTKDIYYDMRKDSNTDSIFPHFNITNNNKIFNDFKNFLISELTPTKDDEKEYVFYLARHGEGIHNKYKKQKSATSSFAKNVCKLKNNNDKDCYKKFKLTDSRLTNKNDDIDRHIAENNIFTTYNTGEEQAEIAGYRLQIILNDKGITSIDYLFCSQLLRTRQTMYHILVIMTEKNNNLNHPNKIYILPCSSEHNVPGKNGDCDNMFSNLQNAVSSSENVARCMNSENVMKDGKIKYTCGTIGDSAHGVGLKLELDWSVFLNTADCVKYNMIHYAIQIINTPGLASPGSEISSSSESINHTDSSASSESSDSATSQSIELVNGKDSLLGGPDSSVQTVPLPESPKQKTVSSFYNTTAIPGLDEDYASHLNNYIIDSFNSIVGKNFGGGSGSGSDTDILDKLKSKIISYISNTNDTTSCVKVQKWKECGGECQKLMLKLFDIELNSTQYNLKCIFDSVISNSTNNDHPYITLKINDKNKKLTGVWVNDQPNINLEINNNNKPTKLIMGFGPSASGKTYIAKTMINMLSKIAGYPTDFLAVDGGIYRQCSIIYKTIIETTNYLNIPGISNLVSSFSVADKVKQIKTLFDSNKVKDNICNFLLTKKYKINLYVPETLGECVLKGNITKTTGYCVKLIQRYIDITGDKENWVALLIWQHKQGQYIDCEFSSEYKCIGCINSGRSREEDEGKIYSSGSYGNSMKYGYDTMLQTKGYRFKIHNTGGNTYTNNGKKTQCKSIFQDFTDYTNTDLTQDNTKKYVDNDDKFIYIEKDNFENINCKVDDVKNFPATTGGRKTRRKNKKNAKKTRRYE